jgi:hypothetical protein
MTYAKFPLSEIELSKLILIKEVIKKYREQDGSRWIFRSPARLAIAGASDLYLKLWNPAYFRCATIVRGIEAGFFDQATTPALVGVITHKGVCRGYIMRRCTYHRKIEAAFQHLIRQRTRQTGLFLLQYCPHHIMRYGGRYSLVDLEGIYPLQELPVIVYYGTRFQDCDYARFVYQLYAERYPIRGLQLSDLIPDSRLKMREASPLARGVDFARRKVNAAFRHLKAWAQAHGLRKNHIFLIEK